MAGTDKDTSESPVLRRRVGGGRGGEDDEKDNPDTAALQKKQLILSRFKQVSGNLRKLTVVSRRLSVLGRNKSSLKFVTTTTSGWPQVEKRFEKLASTTDDGRLHYSMFGQCIGMDKKSKEFEEELFRALSRRRKVTGDSIDKQQLKEFWDQISDQSFDSRLQTFIAMVDKDGDGLITEEELTEMICLSASTNKLKNIQNQSKEYSALIMEKLDPDNVGFITIDSLEKMLLHASSTQQSVTQTSSNGIITTSADTTTDNIALKCYRAAINHWKRLWVVSLWLIAVSSLFAYKYIQFRHAPAFNVMGHCVCVAKASAETLKFNMALVLLPVCRNTITWLRNKTYLGLAVPFDDNLNFHKVIAAAVAVGGVLHTVAHLTCNFPRVLNASPEEYEPLKKSFGEVQPESFWWFVKANPGWTGIVMIMLMALAFTLAMSRFRTKRFAHLGHDDVIAKRSVKERLNVFGNKITGFNAFWYTHHLFVIVYALLVFHSNNWYQNTTWMYLAVPMILYGSERLIRGFRSSIQTVKIIEVTKYPGNVLALQMSKPKGFNYKSGQYMFVNCSVISPFQWHPFSITSAPREDYLSVHIRALGDWTEHLITKFSDAKSYPKISIDGPYGAPAQDYSKYDVVLLVGLGIGGTPMISIIKDIIHNNINIKEKKHKISNPKPNTKVSGYKTQKAYFYWVTPEQDCSQWFKEVMNEVAEIDEMRLIELHNYCTSVYEEGDARSALITMLQSLQYAKKGVDVVSGTRVKSQFARPDWRKVYKNIARHHPDTRVGVFYCGAPTLTKDLRNMAREFTRKTSTKFDFHKENF